MKVENEREIVSYVNHIRVVTKLLRKEMEVIVDVGDMLLQAKEVEAVDGKAIGVAVEVMVKMEAVI